MKSTSITNSRVYTLTDNKIIKQLFNNNNIAIIKNK